MIDGIYLNFTTSTINKEKITDKKTSRQKKTEEKLHNYNHNIVTYNLNLDLINLVKEREEEILKRK